MDFQFQYRDFYLLFAAIPVFILLYLLLVRWKKKVRKKMGDARLINALTSNFSPGLFTSKFALLSIAFAVGVVAVMNPRKPGAADNITRKGIDVVVALDMIVIAFVVVVVVAYDWIDRHGCIDFVITFGSVQSPAASIPFLSVPPSQHHVWTHHHVWTGQCFVHEIQHTI